MNSPLLIASYTTSLKLGLGILGPDGVARIGSRSFHMPDFRTYVGHFDFLRSATDRKSIVGIRLWTDAESDLLSCFQSPYSPTIATDHKYFISLLFDVDSHVDDEASVQYLFLDSMCLASRQELVLAVELSDLNAEELASIQKYFNWS